jgi:ribosomal protection tetracycline resistance protein
LNLGILAHVDAGKTTLTERLLHAAGVIDRMGRVDDGSTQTDSLALERRRGITIRSGVVALPIGDLTVDLIDTPGHPDFVAEVERVLDVLDGAVLVVSAVEGVQPQTRLLMRTLRRLRIPTLVFVNKIDRGGARYEPVLRSIRERLSPGALAMGGVSGLGTRGAAWAPYTPEAPQFVTGLVDVLADASDSFLARYLEDEAAFPYPRLREELAVQTARAAVHPVFFGSAVTGAGVESLMAGIRQMLPRAGGDPAGPVSAAVFKIERGAGGDRLAYARMFSGTLRARDRVLSPRGVSQRVTAVSLVEPGGASPRDSVPAGRIAKLSGLHDIRVGDAIGVAHRRRPGRAELARPTLETVVVPSRSGDAGRLYTSLVQLAEQEPLIDVRRNAVRGEITVSLYGEVQKEVIQATLAEEFGVDVSFRETTPVCIERPVGTGAAAELIGTAANPFLATVGLRVEPAPAGAGVTLALDVELGSMPPAFFKAVEDSVRATLRQGLHGWEVTDCAVTITHSGYWARQSHAHGTFDKSMSSTAGDFRNLTPLVLMNALRRAGTRVYEPVHRFRLELPADVFESPSAAFAPLLPALTRLGAVPRIPSVQGSFCVVEGDIRAARLRALEQAVPTLTSGEGTLESGFDHHRLADEPVPTRARWDANPLDRADYLRQVAGRVPRAGEVS